MGPGEVQGEQHEETRHTPSRPFCNRVGTLSSSGGDTTVNVLTMAENTLGGALLFFHDMESDGVCSTDFHDCEVQVYVKKVENSVRGLSRSVKRGAYCISRNM